VTLATLAAGCAHGPTVNDMGPEKDLVYPGATEIERSFRPEDNVRTVDGRDLHVTSQVGCARSARLVHHCARAGL